MEDFLEILRSFLASFIRNSSKDVLSVTFTEMLLEIIKHGEVFPEYFSFSRNAEVTFGQYCSPCVLIQCYHRTDVLYLAE